MKRGLKILLIVLITLLLVVIAGPFLVPAPNLADGKNPQELADSDSRFIEINGHHVHYKESGQGEPVLILLHGFGASLFSWREVMEPLSAYGRVIAYDRPAFGLTDRPLPGEWTGMSPYGVSAQVKLLMDLMDQMGTEKAILIGNSMGGTISMNFYMKYPDRVQALVLVDAAVYTSGGAPDWVKPLLDTPQMDHLGPLFARSILGSGPRLLEMAWHDPSKITPDVLTGYELPLQITAWDRALWELTKADSGIDLKSHLDEFAVPVLVITGDDDRIVPTVDSILLAEQISEVQLVIIPQAGHVPHEEQPEEFLQAVIDFLTHRGLITPWVK